MNIKNVVSVIAPILVFVVALIGCEDQNVKKLKQQVAAADAECPFSYGVGGDLISVKYDENNNNVNMLIAVNEEYCGHIFVKENKEAMMSNFRLMLSNNNMRGMLNDIANAKAGLSFTFKAPSTGKTLKLSLTNKELKEIKDSQLTDLEIQKLFIENMITLQNTACPYDLYEDVKITKVYLADDFMVYDCEVDEVAYDFKVVKGNIDAGKKDLLDNLEKGCHDPTLQKQLGTLTKTGIGIKYHYYGNKSNDYVDIILTTDDIYKFVDK